MIGRRYLLKGGAAALASALASACTKRLPASCVDAPALEREDAQIRANVAYVEPSPDPEKRCETCRQYTASGEPSQCGGCKVVKGPIHPNGSCKVYGAKG